MTALIVIDLLEDFFDADLWPQSAIPAARARLVEKTNDLTACCRAAEVPVLWFRQEFKPDLSDAFLNMRKKGLRYTIAGTPGCQLLSDLHREPSDIVLLKTRFSAFYRTQLDAELARLKVRTVILAGITTAWCVRSTAVDAYQRDMEVIVAEECVAAFTDETHLSSVAAMEGYLGTFVSNREIARMLTSGSKLQ